MARKLYAILLVFSLCALYVQGETSAKTDKDITIHQIDGNPFEYSSKISGLDRRGMALCLRDDILYYGAGPKVFSLNATDPMKLEVVGKVDIVGRIRQIVENNGYLYVTSHETGMWVIDATTPSAMKVVARYDAAGVATGVDVAGDILFISLGQSGIELVDISDRSFPKHICIQKTSDSQSCHYHDGILYSGDFRNSEITVIGAFNPAETKQLKTVTLNGNVDGVHTRGNRLYASTGGKTGHALEIFDITDKLNPLLLSRIPFDEYKERGTDMWTVRLNGDGTMAFCSDSFNGIYAVDAISSKVIGHISFTASTGQATPCTSVAVGKGVLYAAVQKLGLVAIKCKNATPDIEDKGKLPINSSYRKSYELSSQTNFSQWQPEERVQVHSVASYGQYLYAACSDAGLYILKPEKNGTMTVVGKGPSVFAGDVKVKDKTLYVAEGGDGLGIYNITGKGEGLQLKHKIEQDLCLWVWVPNNDYVVVTNRVDGYVFLNSQTFYPLFQHQKVTGHERYLPNVSLDGKLLPVINPNKGIFWIDLSGEVPSYYSDINDADRPQMVEGICQFQDKYLVPIKGRLALFESGQLKNLNGTPWQTVGKGLSGCPAWDGFDKVAITNRLSQSIIMVNLTDRNKPITLWKEKTMGIPETSIFWKDKLVVPCGYQGLLIEKK